MHAGRVVAEKLAASGGRGAQGVNVLLGLG